MPSVLFGYIAEAWPGALIEYRALNEANEVRIADHNEAVLGGLPERDDWPPLTRTMFGWPPRDAIMISYTNRLFHFAAGLKEVDWNFWLWVAKFERLLRNLYWEEALVILQGAYAPPCEFRWRVKPEWKSRLSKGALEPVTEWDMETDMEKSLWSHLRQA
jgi:hypothetical protein